MILFFNERIATDFSLILKDINMMGNVEAIKRGCKKT